MGKKGTAGNGGNELRNLWLLVLCLSKNPKNEAQDVSLDPIVNKKNQE